MKDMNGATRFCLCVIVCKKKICSINILYKVEKAPLGSWVPDVYLMSLSCGSLKLHSKYIVGLRMMKK